MAISGTAIEKATLVANTKTNANKNLRIPDENFLYFHHIGKYLIIPVDPDSLQDSMSASFAQNFPISRSAPIYSYQNSGPRTVQASFKLHRDLCKEYNPSSNDAVEDLVKYLNAAVLPDYQSSGKIVNPPLVSMQIRNELYIKGVVNGAVSLTYGLPIVNYGTANAPSYKYAQIDISFSISEVTPYSASIVGKYGPYRN